jgi:dipeptide/tripeptide permease
MDNPNDNPPVAGSPPLATAAVTAPSGVADQTRPTMNSAAVLEGGGPAGVALQVNAVRNFFASHPRGFWFFFWGEFAERCSFYGMRGILTLYLTRQLNLGEANGATFFSVFVAACYFLPLLGGWVADNFLGKYWTIVGFSLPYILGHVILGIEQLPFVIFALTLLAMGSGVIKPNISTLMGLTYDQQRPGQTGLRSDAFAMFYFAINVGAFLSSMAMPLLRDKWGYQIAFLFPALLMVVAFGIFASGKRYYAVEQIGNKAADPLSAKERWNVLGRIAGLFILVMFFWAIFDQASSTWIFFGQVYMDLRLFGFEAPPDQIQALNPLFIMALLPVVTLFWKFLDRRGLKVRPTDKLFVGFVLTASTMAIMALAGLLAGPAENEMELVLKEGEVTFTRARLVFNDQIVDVENGKIVAKDRKFTLVSGQIVDPAQASAAGAESSVGRMNLKEGLASVIAQGHVTVKDGTYLIDGAVFVKNGTVTALNGSVFLVDGGVNAATGALEKKGDQIVQKEGDKVTVVLEPGKYVLPQNKVTVWWQVLAFLIITIAEILISVTGLELAYSAAPKSMTGFVTGCWLLTVGLANLFINAPVTRLYAVMPPAAYFGALAGVLLVVSALFVVVARQFNAAVAAAQAKQAALEAAGVAAIPVSTPGQPQANEGFRPPSPLTGDRPQ